MAIGFSKSGLRKASSTSTVTDLIPTNFDRTSDLRNSAIPCKTLEDYRSEITKLWDHARQSFLLIGRYLNTAKDELAHGEYQLLIERDLPFGRSQAFQFRAIATLVDTGKVLADELPSSASIAYELSKLAPVDLEDARRSGLLRGNVTRNQIRSWRREKSLTDLRAVSRESRARMRESLQRRIERLQQDLANAKEELKRLESPGPDLNREPAQHLKFGKKE
jgi:hypothetical protein